MALMYACDGCDTTTKDIDSFHKRGHIIERHYCSECIESVDLYLQALETMHEKCAKKWQSDLEKLRKVHSKGKRALPDVAD